MPLPRPTYRRRDIPFRVFAAVRHHRGHDKHRSGISRCRPVKRLVQVRSAEFIEPDDDLAVGSAAERASQFERYGGDVLSLPASALMAA